MKNLQSKGTYTLFALLAAISGAAAGVLGALFVTMESLVNVKDLTQHELENMSPWGWAAVIQNDKAFADMLERVIWGMIAAGLVFVISVVILSVMTGRFDRDEDGRIRLNWFDRLWSELHLCGAVAAGICAVVTAAPLVEIFRFSDWFRAYKPYEADNYCFGIRNGAILALCAMGMAALIGIAVAGWLALVKKVKAKELLNRSLTGKIIRSVWSGLRSAFRALRRSFRGLSVPGDADPLATFKMMIKYIVIAAVLILFPLFCIIFFGWMELSAIIGLLVSIGAAAFIIVRKIGKLAEIRAGVIAVKSGDLSHRITVETDVNGPKTDLDKLASDINHISEATDAAVQNEIKNQRLKTDLISNVSHDLKTPLTSMISYLDILETEGLDSPDAPAHLAIVKEKTERLRVLTEELFEAAKASSGNIPCEIEDIDIAALIDQSLAEMEFRLEEKELIIKKTIKADNTIVRADGKLMYRVFENLLSNISKYALEGSRVYIDVSEAGDKLLIEFKNISKAELNISADELMERFTRGDQSRNTEGSGLGLAIARDLVTLMNGRFDIRIDGDMFKASILI